VFPPVQGTVLGVLYRVLFTALPYGFVTIIGISPFYKINQCLSIFPGRWYSKNNGSKKRPHQLSEWCNRNWSWFQWTQSL